MTSAATLEPEGQKAVRDLSANAHQRHQPELYLVPIGMAVDVNVIKRNCRCAVLHAETQTNAFIVDLAVPLGVPKRVCKLVRRRYHIIQQTDLAEIEVL